MPGAVDPQREPPAESPAELPAPRFLHGLEEVKRHLMDQGELVLADGRGLNLRAEPRGRIARLIVFEPRPGETRFALVLPLTVAPERLPDFVLALAKVNAQLGVGAFQLRSAELGWSTDSGWTAVFALHVYHNHDGTISSLVVDRAVNACRVTTEHFLLDLFPPEPPADAAAATDAAEA